MTNENVHDLSDKIYTWLWKVPAETTNGISVHKYSLILFFYQVCNTQESSVVEKLQKKKYLVVIEPRHNRHFTVLIASIAFVCFACRTGNNTWLFKS